MEGSSAPRLTQLAGSIFTGNIALHDVGKTSRADHVGIGKGLRPVVPATLLLEHLIAGGTPNARFVRLIRIPGLIVGDVIPQRCRARLVPKQVIADESEFCAPMDVAHALFGRSLRGHLLVLPNAALRGPAPTTYQETRATSAGSPSTHS